MYVLLCGVESSLCTSTYVQNEEKISVRDAKCKEKSMPVENVSKGKVASEQLSWGKST